MNYSDRGTLSVECKVICSVRKKKIRFLKQAQYQTSYITSTMCTLFAMHMVGFVCPYMKLMYMYNVGLIECPGNN